MRRYLKVVTDAYLRKFSHAYRGAPASKMRGAKTKQSEVNGLASDHKTVGDAHGSVHCRVGCRVSSKQFPEGHYRRRSLGQRETRRDGHHCNCHTTALLLKCCMTKVARGIGYVLMLLQVEGGRPLSYTSGCLVAAP